MSNTLIIPDLHIPFEHKKALKFCVKIRNEYNCKKVIQLGDLFDQYSFSRYDKDPDAMSARTEIIKSRRSAAAWADEFPNLIITRGNHCLRLQRHLARAGIPYDVISQTLSEIFNIPKTWTWHDNYVENNIVYMHGATAGEYAHVNTSKNFRCSIVQGHAHSAMGIHYMQGPLARAFGVNAGCLIDVSAYSFAYAREMIRKPVLGAVVMIDGKIPFIIPME